MDEILREVTPLTQYDCFTAFVQYKKGFDGPLHYHEEFELNLVAGGKGAKRIVGDHSEVIDDLDLVLVGGNLPHGWSAHQYVWEEGTPEVYEVTVQFHRNLLDGNLMKKNQLHLIRVLLEKAARGVGFPSETIRQVKPRLQNLTEKKGFESVLELLAILHELSLSHSMFLLSNSTFTDSQVYHSRRLGKVFAYLREHYHQNITLEDVSRLAGMTEVSFSRFVKKRTGKTFVESLNEIRLGHASRLLIDTYHTIAQVAYKCGFNNLSYFNRVFKHKNGCTPSEFRETYAGTRTFV